MDGEQLAYDALEATAVVAPEERAVVPGLDVADRTVATPGEAVPPPQAAAATERMTGVEPAQAWKGN